MFCTHCGADVTEQLQKSATQHCFSCGGPIRREVPSTPAQLAGIRGWLLVLVVSLTLVVPAQSQLLILEHDKLTGQLDGAARLAYKFYDLIVTGAYGLLIVFSAIAGLALARRTKHAVRVTRAYLVSTVVSELALFIVALNVEGLPQNVAGPVAFEHLLGLGGTLLYSLFWLLYLAVSKRVKQTFALSAGRPRSFATAVPFLAIAAVAAMPPAFADNSDLYRRLTDPNLGLDITDAVSAGFVDAVYRAANGVSSGSSVVLTVSKRANDSRLYHLTIPPGLRLANPNGNEQEMVVARLLGPPSGVGYRPLRKITIDSTPGVYLIEAYCAQFHKDNPRSATILPPREVDHMLACILRNALDRGLSVGARQAAVWQHTDRVTYSGLIRKFPLTEDEWTTATSVVTACQTGTFLPSAPTPFAAGTNPAAAIPEAPRTSPPRDIPVPVMAPWPQDIIVPAGSGRLVFRQVRPWRFSESVRDWLPSLSGEVTNASGVAWSTLDLDVLTTCGTGDPQAYAIRLYDLPTGLSKFSQTPYAALGKATYCAPGSISLRFKAGDPKPSMPKPISPRKGR